MPNHQREPLTFDEIRIDFINIEHNHDRSIIEIDAAAENTRYHCLFVRLAFQGQWWIMCENLMECAPLLPQLRGWHWTYLTKFFGNARTAMAVSLLLDHAGQQLDGEF